jgi:chromosome partitioning protein
MSILTVASQKGGVGKTTLALNLAFALARRGWRTLLVDTDPQGSIGLSLRDGVGPARGLGPYLAGVMPLEEAVIKTRLSELCILPADAAVLDEANEREAQIRRALPSLLANALWSYEVVLLDTPSGLRGNTFAALQHTDHVLVPLQAEPLALRTVQQVLDVVGKLRDEGRKLSIAGLVLTMLQSRDEVSLATAQEAWSLLPKSLVLEGNVPRDPAFLRASACGVPVGLLSRRPPAVASVFDQIAAEVELRIGLTVPEGQNEVLSLLA